MESGSHEGRALRHVAFITACITSRKKKDTYYKGRRFSHENVISCLKKKNKKKRKIHPTLQQQRTLLAANEKPRTNQLATVCLSWIAIPLLFPNKLIVSLPQFTSLFTLAQTNKMLIKKTTTLWLSSKTWENATWMPGPSCLYPLCYCFRRSAGRWRKRRGLHASGLPPCDSAV